MRTWLDDAQETIEGPSPSLVAQLVAARQPFWLDIENPTDELIDSLAARLGLHPLAVADSKQFDQRGSLEIYGDVAMLIGFGLDAELREPVEVHCYYTTGFLLTMCRAPSPALDGLRRTGSLRTLLGGDPIQVLHHLVSALHDPFPALVVQLDERLDALEQRVLDAPEDEDLAEISAISHRAARVRRTITPGRDLTARTTLMLSLPGATDDSQLYTNDINNELQQTAADLTEIRERCLTLLSLHASLASNRQGSVTRRLAAVATIFLPISFLAGFFGQNFNVLTGTIQQGWPAFLILGPLSDVVCILGTIYWLRRRGWH